MYPYVPKSCCVPGKNEYDCQGMRNEFNGYPVITPPPAMGLIQNPNLYKEVGNSSIAETHEYYITKYYRKSYVLQKIKSNTNIHKYYNNSQVLPNQYDKKFASITGINKYHTIHKLYNNSQVIQYSLV